MLLPVLPLPGLRGDDERAAATAGSTPAFPQPAGGGMSRSRPLVYSCSGCSSAAQMANHLALRLDRAGVAEFSGFLYEAKTGAPLGAVLPMIGQYRIRSHKLFMIVTWGQQQAQPGRRNPGSSWTEF